MSNLGHFQVHNTVADNSIVCRYSVGFVCVFFPQLYEQEFIEAKTGPTLPGSSVTFHTFGEKSNQDLTLSEEGRDHKSERWEKCRGDATKQGDKLLKQPLHRPVQGGNLYIFFLTQ